jgi:hypothetical protein
VAHANKHHKLVVIKNRMVNAYINFTKVERPRIVDEEPGLDFGDIGRRLGEIWRGLTPQQKASYSSCSYDHHDDEEEEEECEEEEEEECEEEEEEECEECEM